MRLSTMSVLAALPLVLAGCPNRLTTRCPGGEDSSPGLTVVTGSLEVDDGETDLDIYSLSPAMAGQGQCLVGPRREELTGGEDDAEDRVRSHVWIDCATNAVPELLVRLPDLRELDASDESVAATADVTFGEDCVAEELEVPAAVIVTSAAGGADPETQEVTLDYQRSADVVVEIPAGTRPGINTSGAPCNVSVPAMLVAVQVDVTYDDFDSSRGGCL